MEYASKGVAGTGLGLGIAGTALGVLGGGLNNILGTGWNGNGGCCSENTPVNRYELNMERTLAQKEAEIAYLNGQNETNRKLTDVYTNLESQINGLRDTVYHNRDEQNCVNTQQAVYNGTNTAVVNCLRGEIEALQTLTKLVIPSSNVCTPPTTTTTG